MSKLTSLAKWFDKPKQALEVYNPKFRDMTLEQIEKDINFEQNYKPHGYTAQTFNWNIATVFITK